MICTNAQWLTIFLQNIFVSYDMEHFEEDEDGVSCGKNQSVGGWGVSSVYQWWTDVVVSPGPCFVENTGEDNWFVNSDSDSDSDWRWNTKNQKLLIFDVFWHFLVIISGSQECVGAVTIDLFSSSVVKSAGLWGLNI